MSETWLSPSFDGMLPELRALPNWVLAQAMQRDGKTTKVPCHPSGYKASVSDQRTWSSFDAVRAAYEAGGYIGVGFMLDGEPHFGGRYLHGFDWDHCASDGLVDPAILNRVTALRISRLEISISGNGLRGFFLHHELLRSRRTQIDGRSVELYSNLRYMTVTGSALPGWEALQ